MTQNIDHFGWLAPPLGNFTYAQRYLTYDKYWDPVKGAIFFYVGNEGDVTLYADHSGLMWESAAAFGAYIVFAEHRYYGQSGPFGAASLQYPQYLTHEQAQADYAVLAQYLTGTLLGVQQPIILFGGSYGGMLASWTRTKYPGIFAGAVAASAPILAFQGITPSYNTADYWAVVTRDATPAAGSAATCAPNVQAAFAALWAQEGNPAGLAKLTTTMNVCTPLATHDDLNALAFFALGAWDTEAMGNFPYPSNYLTGGGANPELPAFPVRASCEVMAGADPADPWSLLAALSAATGVLNNVSGTVECYNPPSAINSMSNQIWESGEWDISWCFEALPEETYWARNGAYPDGDMFWPFPFDQAAVEAHCMAELGVKPRWTWISQIYGGSAALGSSNIVFSNGGYDPWSSGGVKVSQPGLPVVFIPEGAHHLDLFFSNPADPPSVTAARTAEMGYVREWTTAWWAARGQ
jgi:lysosomal Pro-X carboxypeptidase